MQSPRHYAIAIDGPAASGKSTIAKCLARELGLVMVNSGAMYRAVTWKILELGIDPQDSAAIIEAMNAMDLQCGVKGTFSTVAIDGKVLDEELRATEVNHAVSIVAAIPRVREVLVQKQRDYLQHTSVVMEGRDIDPSCFPTHPTKSTWTPAKKCVRRGARRRASPTASPRATKPTATAAPRPCWWRMARWC